MFDFGIETVTWLLIRKPFVFDGREWGTQFIIVRFRSGQERALYLDAAMRIFPRR